MERLCLPDVRRARSLGASCVLFLGVLLGTALPAQAGSGGRVVLNEVFYDADGADAEHEWVELYNAGDEAAEIGGWRIERAGAAFAKAFVFPADTAIPPGGFLVVGSASVPGADLVGDLGLQNGGSATDGVRLLDDDGGVVDVLLYDEPNANALPDETGSAGSSFAPDVAAGHSLARVPDGADTNASGVDFHDSASPTPTGPNTAASGAPPPPPAAPSPTPTATTAATAASLVGVVVNEALPNPVGDDTTGEFIELLNTASAPADLGGAQLDDAEGGSRPYRIPDGTTLGPGAFRAFPRSEAKLALNNEGDSVRLLAPDGSVVHILTYPKVPREGASWARRSGTTAEWTATPTPGAANVFTPLPGDEDEEDDDAPSAARATPSPTPRVLGSAARTTPTPSPRAQATVTVTATPVSHPSALPASTRASGRAAGPPTDGVVGGGGEDAVGAAEPDGGAADLPGEDEGGVPAEAAGSAGTPRRLPVPALIAWGAAGVLGILRVLKTRA